MVYAADFFVFLVETGAGPYSEATALRWEDIRDGKFVYFGPTKNGNERTIPLTARAREAVERQRTTKHNQKGPWSDISQWAMVELWRKIRGHLTELDDTVLYTARHTCASWQVIRGIDIRRVQIWMGHKNISTTLIYAHLTPDHLLDNLRALEGDQAPNLRAVDGGRSV